MPEALFPRMWLVGNPVNTDQPAYWSRIGFCIFRRETKVSLIAFIQREAAVPLCPGRGRVNY